MSQTVSTDPHAGQPVLHVGVPLGQAAGALILLHGRGASAQDILMLGQAIAPRGWAMLAPQAAGHTWYPNSFLAPRERNEPWLSSALRKVEHVLRSTQDAGVTMERIVLAGFSQGACLCCEFAGTHARRYGAVLALTGGMIGPSSGELRVTGDFAGTPVLLSSGDPDPHVPWERVQRTSELFTGAGAEVTLRRFPGRPHTVSDGELELARDLLGRL